MPETATQRSDQSSVSLSVEGKDAPFVFNKKTGGKADSEGSKSFPGGMRPQKAHGGPQVVEDLTLEGEFVPGRDNDFIQWLKSVRGWGVANAAEHALDRQGNVWGQIGSWVGVLKSV